MSATKVPIHFYTQHLNAIFTREFPDDQFLYEELDGVMQAIVNAISLSCLEKAVEEADGDLITKPTEVLETTDHFCTRWIPREDLVFCIENTSGLGEEHAARALRIVEEATDTLTAGDGKIVVEHLGTIAAMDAGQYSIELAKELLIEPLIRKAANLEQPMATRTAGANSG